MEDLTATCYLPKALCNDIQAYMDLHPDLSFDQAIAKLLELGLRRADKATVHAPVDLLADLADCAYKLGNLNFSAMEPTALVQVQFDARAVHNWSCEYLVEVRAA